MSEYYVAIETKIKDGILSPEEIKKAKEKLPTNYTALGDPTITFTKKHAIIVFKCTKKEEPKVKKTAPAPAKKSVPVAAKKTAPVADKPKSKK